MNGDVLVGFIAPNSEDLYTKVPHVDPVDPVDPIIDPEDPIVHLDACESHEFLEKLVQDYEGNCLLGSQLCKIDRPRNMIEHEECPDFCKDN
jgi:hypothetical protein